MIEKSKALALLGKQIEEADRLASLINGPHWREMIHWFQITEAVVVNIFGPESRQFERLISMNAALKNNLGSSVLEPKVLKLRILDGKDLVLSFIFEIEKVWPELAAPAPKNTLKAIEQICSRFHLVARQIRSRHANRETLQIEDEYDVQDLFHALLVVEFDDIRPEEWAPSYAGATSRTDFLLKQEQIMIEIKKTRKNLGAREVGEQLIIDIQRYKVHPDCKSLICFVYDPEGWIPNPRGIENDLNNSGDGFDVKVIIAP
jgi:hypothetical protein